MSALVVVSLEPWDEVWRRNQHLVHGLLVADPVLEVLFVEPAADPLHDLSSRRRPRFGRGTRTVPGYGRRLTLVRPTKWLPRALGSAADAMLARRVRAAVRRRGWPDVVLWVNDPLWAGFATDSGWPTVYDMTDDWVEAAREGRVSRRLRAADGQLLAAADEVVVCSRGLELSRGRARPVTLIPNAVDLAPYGGDLARPDDVPAGDVALYAGTLHEDRLDVEATVATAQALRARGAALVLVGPDALAPANSRRIAAAGGVLLGGRPFERIPAYLRHADVLVVPHLVTTFTDSLDPIKLYEYQAAGRPIVATPVAGFRELADHPGVAIVGAAGFATTVADMLEHPPAAPVWDRLPDWSTRAAAFSEVLQRLRASTPSGRG